MSLIDAFQLILAIQQHLYGLTTVNTFLLATDPLAALYPLSVHYEGVQTLVSSARNDVNLLISMLNHVGQLEK